MLLPTKGLAEQRVFTTDGGHADSLTCRYPTLFIKQLPRQCLSAGTGLNSVGGQMDVANGGHCDAGLRVMM